MEKYYDITFNYPHDFDIDSVDTANIKKFVNSKLHSSHLSLEISDKDESAFAYINFLRTNWTKYRKFSFRNESILNFSNFKEQIQKNNIKENIAKKIISNLCRIKNYRTKVISEDSFIFENMEFYKTHDDKVLSKAILNSNTILHHLMLEDQFFIQVIQCDTLENHERVVESIINSFNAKRNSKLFPSELRTIEVKKLKTFNELKKKMSNPNITRTEYDSLKPLYNKTWKEYSQVKKLRLECGEAKPVIYLYPEKEKEVSIKLNYNGIITHTYPKFNSDKGWKVIAKPDGTLIDKLSNKKYYCLFWEGTKYDNYNLNTGFVVKGEDTIQFLEEKLEKLGLNYKERNEFIIYWLPKMENNKYNLIHFANKEYTTDAKLDITPKPDNLVRVFMVFKALEEPIDIDKQKIVTPERSGFTVVEWGGTDVSNYNEIIGINE